jgi:hypothetical protein
MRVQRDTLPSGLIAQPLDSGERMLIQDPGSERKTQMN